jgi:class 3 adenylate cyclase
MDFFEILDQVIDLLGRRGRVTSRALQLPFRLDDTSLAVLKEELIKAQHVAADENHEVLVWVGRVGSTPAPALHPSEPVQRPATEDDRAAHVPSPPAESHTPDAERRQLTVMFCNLVDSTTLSGQLDPEDYREVVQVYQETGAAVIQRFGGYIAQYLGDGLLVYIGYPQANEDDAQHAVHAGLGIVAAVGELNTHLEQRKGVGLAVRIGIHTGLVVVGDRGGGSRQEQLALGETPTWPPASKGSRLLIRWPLAPLPSVWSGDTLPTRSLVPTVSGV